MVVLGLNMGCFISLKNPSQVSPETEMTCGRASQDIRLLSGNSELRKKPPTVRILEKHRTGYSGSGDLSQKGMAQPKKGSILAKQRKRPRRQQITVPLRAALCPGKMNGSCRYPYMAKKLRERWPGIARPPSKGHAASSLGQQGAAKFSTLGGEPNKSLNAVAGNRTRASRAV